MVPIEFPADVVAQLESLAQTSNYPVDAYEFVMREIVRLMWHRGSLPEQERGVSDRALCWKLHDSAVREFDSQARQTLATWNIHRTNDFGIIVFELADKGLITMREEDCQDNFNDVFDFDDAFQELHFDPMPLLPTRWRVSTLLAITTMLAIAFAGISRSGIDGALGTLLATWLIIIGAFVTYLGINERTKDWLLATVAGIVLIGLGIVGFVLITS